MTEAEQLEEIYASVFGENGIDRFNHNGMLEKLGGLYVAEQTLQHYEKEFE